VNKVNIYEKKGMKNELNHKKIKLYSLATTYPESSSSTKPKFVHILNKELAKLGVYVKVIAPHSKGSLRSEMMDLVFVKRFRYLMSNNELNERSIPDEIRRSRFGKIKVSFMIFSFFVFTMVECLKEKPDIIHGQWAFPGGYIAYIVSKIFGSKCVVSIHGAETPLLKKYNFIRRLVINSLNKSSLVIVNSKYTKNEYVKMGVREDKINWINPPPNFVKHISNVEELRKFRQKFTADENKIILFVGRLVERKGVEYLIKSLAEIKTQKFHLMIAGNGWLLDDLVNLTNSLNLQDKVTFFDSPSHEELGKLYDMSDVFVCPSIIDSKGETEGVGLVIPEAMESGLPVIATSVGGIVDLIKNEENGILINQKSSTAIAQAIDRILNNKELTQKIVNNSKQTVLEFQPPKIAKKHFISYHNLLKN